MRPRRNLPPPHCGYQLSVLDCELVAISEVLSEAWLSRVGRCAICPEWSPQGFVMWIDPRGANRVFLCDPKAHAAYYDALERAATLRA